MNVTRVLIVDDSASIRRLIRAHLHNDARLEVVGEASDPYEAREMIKALKPDVLTLDVEMPKMDGLAFLEKLMRLRPMPVVMLSTLTQAGSRTAVEALSLGAIDCFAKPDGRSAGSGFDGLGDMLVAAAKARPRASSQRGIGRAIGLETQGLSWQTARVSSGEGAAGNLNGRDRRHPHSGPFRYRWNGTYVVIGSSTGGVDALETVLAQYPVDCPPTLITQHMPESFLASFAHRLNRRIAPQLELATDGAPLLQGRVYLAPGGLSHLAVTGGDEPCCRLFAAPPRSGHRPSVDVLFQSACMLAPNVLAVMLTGMGRDGAEEMLSLRRAGARCIAQDEESSVVFGMPRAALEGGGAERAVSLTHIAGEILTMCSHDVVPAPRRATV